MSAGCTEGTAGPHCWICGEVGRFIWQKEGRKVYRCTLCGFRFVYPLPGEPLLDDFSHAGTILRAQDHFRSEYNRFLSRVEAMTTRGKLLDIGCNIGLSLIVARERGWTPVGIELSHEAARYGREKFGVDIIEMLLEEAGFPDDEFDAVVMYHTLEHVLHPVRMLADVARVLRPAGILYASVPNAGGISAFVLREKWEWVTRDHVSYFGRGTLKMALQKAGFEPVFITSCLGARVAQSKPRWEVEMVDRISNLLCLSISLESWSRKPEIARPFSGGAR